MKLEIYRNFKDLASRAQEWNTLVAESASHVPFLRFEYLSTWWDSLGGGEWPQGELHLVLALSDKGALLGVAPFFSVENLEGKSALMFVGSFEISDYLDLIVRPTDLVPFTDALLAHLLSPAAPAWEVLDLYNLLDDSPTLPALKDAANRLGLETSQETLQPSPIVELPDTWEAYLASIKKKQRHEIRRKIRRAEAAEEGVRWYFVEDETTLEAEIEAFFTLMMFDSNKQAFLTDHMRAQMRQGIRSAFHAGWLQLAFMEIGGQKAAAYLNFDFDNRIWLYNSGINFEFNYYSPGWVLLGYLIQWSIENGRTALDFMRGDENYKYRFGGVNRHVERLQITRS